MLVQDVSSFQSAFDSSTLEHLALWLLDFCPVDQRAFVNWLMQGAPPLPCIESPQQTPRRILPTLELEQTYLELDSTHHKLEVLAHTVVRIPRLAATSGRGIPFREEAWSPQRKSQRRCRMWLTVAQVERIYPEVYRSRTNDAAQIVSNIIGYYTRRQIRDGIKGYNLPRPKDSQLMLDQPQYVLQKNYRGLRVVVYQHPPGAPKCYNRHGMPLSLNVDNFNPLISFCGEFMIRDTAPPVVLDMFLWQHIYLLQNCYTDRLCLLPHIAQQLGESISVVESLASFEQAHMNFLAELENTHRPSFNGVIQRNGAVNYSRDLTRILFREQRYHLLGNSTSSYVIMTPGLEQVLTFTGHLVTNSYRYRTTLVAYKITTEHVTFAAYDQRTSGFVPLMKLNYKNSFEYHHTRTLLIGSSPVRWLVLRVGFDRWRTASPHIAQVVRVWECQTDSLFDCNTLQDLQAPPPS